MFPMINILNANANKAHWRGKISIRIMRLLGKTISYSIKTNISINARGKCASF